MIPYNVYHICLSVVTSSLTINCTTTDSCKMRDINCLQGRMALLDTQ